VRRLVKFLALPLPEQRYVGEAVLALALGTRMDVLVIGETFFERFERKSK